MSQRRSGTAEKPSREEMVAAGRVAQLRSHHRAPTWPRARGVSSGKWAWSPQPGLPPFPPAPSPSPRASHAAQTARARPLCPEQDLPGSRRIPALARSLCVFLARPPHLFLCQHHPRVQMILLPPRCLLAGCIYREQSGLLSQGKQAALLRAALA